MYIGELCNYLLAARERPEERKHKVGSSLLLVLFPFAVEEIQFCGQYIPTYSLVRKKSHIYTRTYMFVPDPHDDWQRDAAGHLEGV